MGTSPKKYVKKQIVEPTIGLEPMNLFLTKEVLYLLSYVGPYNLLYDVRLLYQKPSAAASVTRQKMVVRGGFEPPKASPADLQSAPFGHSGTSPYFIFAAACSLIGAGRRYFASTLGQSGTNGADDGTRTRNLLITNQLLCQLSYAS